MAYIDAELVPLLTNSGFTLWLYRTADTRAVALTAGYFDEAAPRLNTGDIVILTASDSISMCPVRSGDEVAPGLVLDTAAAPFRININAAQRFSVRTVASAVASTVVLAPLAASIFSNGFVDAQATIAGPVTEVAFSISDAGGATVRGPQLAPVSAGSASASLPAPAAGTGYRLRVQATSDSAVAANSPVFSVTLPYAVLLQAGGALLIEDGSRLLV
ncbi:hypothetical protein ACVFYP_04180 [Roseomonas sp. F4]